MCSFDPFRHAREHDLLGMLNIPRLLRDPAWRDADPGQGDSLGVVLVPGFGAADLSLHLTGTWLRARGYRPTGARIGFNVGCTSELVDRIEQRAERHAAATGDRVVLLGQSRGGSLAKVVAVRRPDLVRGLVTLGSPLRDPMNAHPHVLLAARMLGRVAAVGVPGLMNDECFSGSCFEENTRTLAEPIPREVDAVSFYSRSDGIVPWRLSLDPSADCVEVGSTHTGMGFDPDVYAALAPVLTGWAANRSESALLAS